MLSNIAQYGIILCGPNVLKQSEYSPQLIADVQELQKLYNASPLDKNAIQTAIKALVKNPKFAGCEIRDFYILVAAWTRNQDDEVLVDRIVQHSFMRRRYVDDVQMTMYRRELKSIGSYYHTFN